MVTRTTQIDRRIGALCLQGIPPDLPDEVIKGHLDHAGLFHEALGQLLRADLTQVDTGLLARVLQGQEPAWVGAQFQPGVLEAVHALGGQFAQARMTSVPGGEKLDSQRRDKVIEFLMCWHFERLGKGEKLLIAPSLDSEVIYLPGVVKSSIHFDKVEGRDSVQDVLSRLPRVKGLRWVVGNTPTICRVLANHLKGTGEHLLSNVYTWTTDSYESPDYGLRRLLVGVFDSHRVRVRFNYYYLDIDIGLFILGVPHKEQDS